MTLCSECNKNTHLFKCHTSIEVLNIVPLHPWSSFNGNGANSSIINMETLKFSVCIALHREVCIFNYFHRFHQTTNFEFFWWTSLSVQLHVKTGFGCRDWALYGILEKRKSSRLISCGFEMPKVFYEKYINQFVGHSAIKFLLLTFLFVTVPID